MDGGGRSDTEEDENEDDDTEATTDVKPDAGGADAASAGSAGKTRIEIDLSYKKRPFATRHRFA